MTLTPEIYLILSLGGATMVLGLVALVTRWQILATVRRGRAGAQTRAPSAPTVSDDILQSLLETERSLHKVIDLTTRRS